ncbi:hypothetical protein DFQ26_009151 [Actinomortierella ambigua]|nr:hypothetical protein DFQ26_009151 [Actinomortierella ambigua]
MHLFKSSLILCLVLLQTAIVAVQGAMRIYGSVDVSVGLMNTIQLTLFDNGVDQINKVNLVTFADTWSTTTSGLNGYKLKAWWSARDKLVHIEWSRPGFLDGLSCKANGDTECVGGGSRFDPKVCMGFYDFSCWYY